MFFFIIYFLNDYNYTWLFKLEMHYFKVVWYSKLRRLLLGLTEAVWNIVRQRFLTPGLLARYWDIDIEISKPLLRTGVNCEITHFFAPYCTVHP